MVADNEKVDAAKIEEIKDRITKKQERNPNRNPKTQQKEKTLFLINPPIKNNLPPNRNNL